MLCQNCQKSEATTHIKRVINGDTTENHLCAQCAHTLGYDDMFSGFGLSLGDFFGGLLTEGAMPQLTQTSVKRCQKCGSSWHDIVHSGSVGCPECYKLFYEKLQPSLQRIHGKNLHTGKRPSAKHTDNEKAAVNDGDKQPQNDVDALKKQLDEAVAVQNFELAAQLRDQIKSLQ